MQGWMGRRAASALCSVCPCITSPGQGTDRGAEWYSRASQDIVTGTEMAPSPIAQTKTPHKPPVPTSRHSGVYSTAQAWVLPPGSSWANFTASLSYRLLFRATRTNTQFTVALNRLDSVRPFTKPTGIQLFPWEAGGGLALHPSPKRTLLHLLSNALRPHGLQHPGFLVHHQLPEFTQTHVHQVGDAIQPSHSLSSPSLPAFNLKPASGSFQMTQFFASCHQSIGVSASISVLPMNTQD